MCAAHPRPPPPQPPQRRNAATAAAAATRPPRGAATPGSDTEAVWDLLGMQVLARPGRETLRKASYEAAKRDPRRRSQRQPQPQHGQRSGVAKDWKCPGVKAWPRIEGRF